MRMGAVHAYVIDLVLLTPIETHLHRWPGWDLLPSGPCLRHHSP